MRSSSAFLYHTQQSKHRIKGITISAYISFFLLTKDYFGDWCKKINNYMEKNYLKRLIKVLYIKATLSVGEERGRKPISYFQFLSPTLLSSA